MKRITLTVQLIFAVFLAIICVFWGNNVAYAEKTSEETTEQQLEQAVEENLDKLDLSEFERFVSGLTEEERDLGVSATVKEFILGLTEGDYDGATFKNYLSKLAKAAVSDLFGFLPALIGIFIISVFGSMLSSLSSDFLKKETSEIVYFVCYAAVIILLLTAVAPLVSSVTLTVKRIKEFADIVFPILLTLIVAMGGTVSSSAYQPLMAAFTTGIIGMISAVIIPIFIAATVFSVVGNLSESIKLNKMTSFLKSAAEWLLGTVFSVFAAFVAMQGITGATADTVAVSAAKFALNSYVPVLGGYLSDGFDLVLASCVVIKNAVGVTGIVVLLSVILYPVLKLVIFLLALKLTAALSEPFGDGRISALLTDMSKNMLILVSALIGLGFVFYLLLMLVLYTCNMGVI